MLYIVWLTGQHSSKSKKGRDSKGSAKKTKVKKSKSKEAKESGGGSDADDESNKSGTESDEEMNKSDASSAESPKVSQADISGWRDQNSCAYILIILLVVGEVYWRQMLLGMLCKNLLLVQPNCSY